MCVDPQASPSATRAVGLDWGAVSDWWRADSLWGQTPWTTEELCLSFLDTVSREFKCPVASAWSLDPVNQLLLLVGLHGIKRADLKTFTLRCQDSLSGIAVARKRITRFPNLRETTEPARLFGHPHLLEMGLTSMLSVPVLNTANPNQVLLVVNLFAGVDALPLPAQEPRIYLLAAGLAAAVESCLRERCIRYENRLRTVLGRVQPWDQDRLFGAVARLIQQAVPCDVVAIYLESADRQYLHLVCKADPHQFYERMSLANSFAIRSWQRNRETLYIDLDLDAESASKRESRDSEEVMSAACVPLQSLSGQARGVIQCLNLYRHGSQGTPLPFTYDDVAVIEAIGRSCSPRLEILQAEHRRIESLNRLAHELRVPIVAFRAALERVRNECQSNNYKFQFDHFEEMVTYCDVMNRLLKELDIIRRGPQRIPLNPRSTYFLRQIIAPACRFVRPLLVKAGFDRNAISYSGLEDFPNLYVDRGLMTQVVFNLLDNAIKYYPHTRDRAAFSVEIKGSGGPTGYELLFRDHGIGVESGDEHNIFDSGVRGRNAHYYDVAGEGIGLWLARAIVRRHGGDLFLRKQRDPTEFVLFLPGNLVHGPPPEELGVDI